MKNMRVSMKLMAGFGIMILLAASIGIVSILGMKQLNAAASELYDSNLVAVSAMANFREAYQTERTQLRTMILAVGDPSAVQKAVDGFAVLEQTIKDAMDTYESTITDESLEKGYFAAKNTYLGDYSAAKQEMIKAALAGDADLSYQLLLASGPVVTPIVGGLQDSASLNDQWASETNLKTNTLYFTLFTVMIIVLLIAVAVACVLAFYISGLISKPLREECDYLKRAATTGSLDLTTEDIESAARLEGRKDELGEMSASLVAFIVRLQYVSEKLNLIANGDLSVEVDLLSENDNMGLSLKRMLDNLNSMFGDIRTASDQVSSGAGQVSQGAQGLASGSSQQAASIEELSASLAELQDKTNHNAEDSASAQEANNKTAKSLDESIRSMGQMLEAMKEIDESSSSITKVIKVIDDIAFQTNILALNAAVEAARAGQHGKGFAVVADEVRNLAAKSAEAAKETSSLIEGSTERVREGNEIVAKTNANLETAVESAKESTRLIELVADASTEQAKSIGEINQGMDQISTVVQANSATAEQSAAASEEMSAQAVVMNEIVAKFKLRQSENKSIGAMGQGGPNEYTGSTGFSITGSKY